MQSGPPSPPLASPWCLSIICMLKRRPDKTTTISISISTMPIGWTVKTVNCILNILAYLDSAYFYSFVAVNDVQLTTKSPSPPIYQSLGNPAEQTWRCSKEYRRTIPTNVPHYLPLSPQTLRPPHLSVSFLSCLLHLRSILDISWIQMSQIYLTSYPWSENLFWWTVWHSISWLGLLFETKTD